MSKKLLDELKNLNSVAPAGSAPESASVSAETVAPVAAVESLNVDLQAASDALDRARTENPTKKSDLPAQAFDPSVIAAMNEIHRQTMEQTISAMMKQFTAAIADLRKPGPKEQLEIEAIEKFKARQKREKEEFSQQEQERVAGIKALQSACNHLAWDNVKSAICITRNQFASGGAAIGRCVHCFREFKPLRYESLPPTVHTLAEVQEFIGDLAAQSWVPADGSGKRYVRGADLARDLGPAMLAALVQKLGVKPGPPERDGKTYKTLLWPEDPGYQVVKDMVARGV